MKITNREMNRFANLLQIDIMDEYKSIYSYIDIDFAKFRNSKIMDCGDGANKLLMNKGMLLCDVLIGSAPAGSPDCYAEQDIANYTLAFMHEIFGHCKQYGDLAVGIGDDDFLFDMADHFVANQMKDKLGRYYFKYSDDVTEIDANRESIITSLDLLDKYFPEDKYGVDWYDVVCEIWKEKSSHEKTAFAPHGEEALHVAFIPDDMKYHLNQCKSDANNESIRVHGYEYEPRGLYPTVPGDELYDYLCTKASDEVVSLWKNAENDWERNIISCAVFAQEEVDLVSVLSPNLCENERFLLGGINVYDDVAKHQESIYSRSSADIMSKSDVRFLLRDVMDRRASFDAQGVDFGNGTEYTSIRHDILFIEYKTGEFIFCVAKNTTRHE